MHAVPSDHHTTLSCVGTSTAQRSCVNVSIAHCAGQQTSASVSRYVCSVETDVSRTVGHQTVFYTHCHSHHDAWPWRHRSRVATGGPGAQRSATACQVDLSHGTNGMCMHADSLLVLRITAKSNEKAAREKPSRRPCTR